MTNDSNNFYLGKNILVIGGSFGIGESLVRNLASHGANLCISARSEDKIKKIAIELGDKHFAVSCDVTQIEDVNILRDKIEKSWDHIDIIIFCAGIYEPMNLDNFDLKKSKEIVEINFTSFFNIIDTFLPLIKNKKIKQLAVISSIAGYFGMPNSLAYGASKAGLSNLTESLYYELKKYDVKIQLINPGFVKTRLTDKNNFKMPNIIDSNKAANIIMKKMIARDFEISFPWLFSSIMKFLSLLPYKLRFLFFAK